MIQHIKKLFLTIIAFSCLTCFQRADYNLPLFTFAYFLWDFDAINLQKARIYYLFLATWIADFVWIIYWGVTWSTDEYQQHNKIALSQFILVLCILQFLLKIVIIGLLFIYDSQCKLALKNIFPNLKSVFVFDPQKNMLD